MNNNNVKHDVRERKLASLTEAVNKRVNKHYRFDVTLTYDGGAFIEHLNIGSTHTVLVRFPKPDYRKPLDVDALTEVIVSNLREHLMHESSPLMSNVKLRQRASDALSDLTYSLNATKGEDSSSTLS